jgi:hypothetical protein
MCQLANASGKTGSGAGLFFCAELFAALKKAKAKTKRNWRRIPDIFFDTTRLALVPRLFN